ncbi:MAG: tetratricopeptide repeat protein [Nitrospinaceae bacterium]
MSERSFLIPAGIFYLFFLFLTPLGLFNSWVSQTAQTGYYSVTTIDGGDDTGYYAYLRSLFFDGDLDFADERNYAHAEQFTPTGYVFNNWQIGQALLFFPFFLAGHGLAWLYHALGYPVSVDGYSAPYYIATAVASGTWLFAGLLVVFHLLNRFVRERVAWLATLGMWLASPLLYFSFIRQRMAHTVEYFVAAILLLAWCRLRKSEDLAWHVILGGVLGLLCMVRVINVAFFALYVADQAALFLSRDSGFQSARLRKLLVRLAAFTAGFLFLMLPQFYCWYKLNGIPLPPRHLHFAGEGLTGFSPISFLKNLFSLFFDARWGLVFSMPLAVAGIAGLFLKSEFLRGLRFPLLAYVGGLISVIVIYPEDSASYGHRHLISALPVFAVGLAALVERVQETRPGRVGALVFVSGCVLAQYFMIVQYKVTLPYNHPRFSLEALGSVPQLLWDHPGQLLRSTNFVRLLFLDHPQGVDYRDVLFTLIFPLLQLGFVGLAVWAVGNAGRFPRFRAILGLPGIIFGKAVLVTVFLLGIIAWAAPTMSPEEVRVRQTYLERMRLGDSFLGKGDAVQARAAYTEASALMPRLWNPYFKIGVTWNMRGNLTRANEYYAKGLERNPKHSVALTNFGSNLNILGKYTEAESALKAAIRAWPFNKNACDALAQVYVNQRKLHLARGMLETAVTIDPNYGPGHANLAVVYTMMNQPGPARMHLNRALRLGVRGPEVDKLVKLYRPDSTAETQ